MSNVKRIGLKNTTGVPIEIPELGETIPVNSGSPEQILDLTQLAAVQLRKIDGLQNLIEVGDVIIFDGVRDLKKSIAYDYLVNDTSPDSDGFWYGSRRRFSILWQQPSHGFVSGQVLRLDEDSGAATLALADSHANSATTAVVSEVVDADSFYAGLTGSVVEDIDAGAVEGGLPLIQGTAYFLSSTIPGEITSTVPSGAGEIIKLIGLAVGASSIMVFSYSGYANETALNTTEVRQAQVGGLIRPTNTWQRRVLGRNIVDPSILTPSNGDRYIVPPDAIGGWLGFSNNIAEYVASTSSWFFTIPIQGFVTLDVSVSDIIEYTGSAWVVLGAATLNDLGDINTSGVLPDSILQYNETTLNWETTLLPTPKLFFGHNGSIIQTLTSAFTTTDISTVVRNDLLYNIAANEITIAEAGWYKISYSVSAEADSTMRAGIECKMELNNVDIPGSFSWAYQRTDTPGEGTASADILLEISAGDVIRIRMRETSAAAITLHDGCRIVIEQK